MDTLAALFLFGGMVIVVLFSGLLLNMLVEIWSVVAEGDHEDSHYL